jgi:hypothetical protein
MGSASDESTAKGDDRANGLHAGALEKVRSAYHIGHTWARQGDQPDIVLTEVGPPSREIVEGCFDSCGESACRAEIAAESDHPHPFFQICVFQPSRAVDDHDDPVGGEPFSINE